MSKGLRDWAIQGSKVIFLALMGYFLFQYGVNCFLGSAYGEEEVKKITITTAYIGEGVLEVLEGDNLLLSGNGSVSVTTDTRIKVRLTCKEKNLISDYIVNGTKKKFAKGQNWEEEIQNLSDDINIEADFKACNTITIANDERYQLKVDGAEYCCKTAKENSTCYFYLAEALKIKLTPEEFWLINEIKIDGQKILPEALEDFEHIEDYYELSIDSSVQYLSFLLKKEKVTVIIESGTGNLVINDIPVKSGQKIDRCAEYKCSYTTSTENILVDNIWIYSKKVELQEDQHDWKTYLFNLIDIRTQLRFCVYEHSCDVVTSCREYFNLVNQEKNMNWSKKHNTVYIKHKDITLDCAEKYSILKLQSDSNIKQSINTLNITSPAKLSRIVIKGERGYFFCSTPVHFLYDGEAPKITNYSIKTYPTTEERVSPIDITVTAQDTGDAGIDQIMCGTYEEYKQWVAKIESGTYESQHEKGDEELSITYKNQESHIKESYYVWTIDCAANLSEAIKLDMEGPVLQCSTDKGWHNTEFQVTGKADEEIRDIFYSTSYSAYLQHTLGQHADKQTEEQQSGRSKSKAWTFTISAKENKIQAYYIWAYDQYGNKSASPYIYEAKVDVEPPELKLSRNIPEGQWSKDIITLSLKAEETNTKCNSDLEQIYYSTKADCSNPTSLSYKNSKGEYVLQSPKDNYGQPLELNQKYYFWAVDQAGNISQVQETELQIDSKKPLLVEASIIPKSTNSQINNSVYGTCSNGDITLIIKAKEEGISSGLGRMHLYQDGKEMASALGEKGRYRFTLSKPFYGEISFQVEDGVGHESSQMTISQLNTNLSSSYFRLEDKVPQVQVDYPSAIYADALGRKWYKQDVSFSLTYQDKGSGVKNVSTWINDQLLVMDHKGSRLPSNQAPGVPSLYTIYTSQVQPRSDGSYHLRVQVTDYCGNVKEEEHVIYIDKEAPRIGQFTFTARNKSYQQVEMVKKESYGYYFEGKTLVRIQAMDQVASSGIHKISFYTIDYAREQAGVKSKVKVLETDTNGGVEIVLSAGFKGQIYARAQDYVGNYANEFSKPYGVIIESVKANSSTADVEFLLPTTEYADQLSHPLYRDNIELTFTAQDYFNGIEKVEWTVTSPQDSRHDQSGRIMVDSNGKMDDLVKETEVTRDRNLVTSIKHNILVSNNSNDICVKVRITDRSGHSYSKSMFFSIDKTKPQVTVVVPGQSKAGRKEYFNKGQVVQLLVKERNFDPKKVSAVINKDSVGGCSISQWRVEKDATNPDNNLYMATVSCEKDGAYSIRGGVEDRAGNATTMVEDEFVVDTTNPKVQLTFSGTKKTNGNPTFFAQNQTATITMEEHNLDPSKVEIRCRRVRSLNNQVEEDCRQPSEIVTSGDMHTSTLDLIGDGWYTIEVTCSDKAGNGLQQTVHSEFGIDTTNPSIRVEGVGQKSANNGEFFPLITILDDNYDSDRVKISLIGSRTGEAGFVINNNSIKLVQGDNEISRLIQNGTTITKALETSTQTTGSANKGQQIRMNCFPDKEGLDDLYTLTIEAEDIVGNKSSHSVEFSVNRYGSVYSFSRELQMIAGTYVQSMGNVRFTETNVNSLVKEDTQIKLSRNGVVTDLVEDKDYNVNQTGDSKKWSQYIYDLDKNLFEEEGRYTIMVHSKDTSGNINENDLASKGAQMVFGVDKTNPIVIVSNIKDGAAYDETSKQANISISDNIALKKVNIYLNDVVLDYNQEDDLYQFTLPSSNKEQNIKVVAEDSAGNITIKEINHIFVTTNLWIRFCHNKVLLTLTGFIGILILLGTLYVIIIRRKRLGEKNICEE